MADRQFNPLGTVAAPGSWTLPPGLQILLKGVYAEFDGAGAAGSFQPAFEIQTDSGHTQGVFTCDTSVAAGASADVTWFRGLAPPAAAVAQGAPYIRIGAGGISIPSGAGTTQLTLDPTVISWGTDAGPQVGSDTFDMHTFDGGVHYSPTILKPGAYLCFATLSVSIAGAPAAGSVAFLNTLAIGSVALPVGGMFTSPWLTTLGGQHLARASMALMCLVDTIFEPPPAGIDIEVGQNSGATANNSNFDMFMFRVNDFHF